jgi:hypothetical protein
VWVDQSGDGQYKESPDDDQPVPVRLEASEAEQVFALAEKLSHFSSPLESGLKVAFTGNKTFRYVDGTARPGVTFNYTRNPDGQALLKLFEGIAQTARHLINLERASRFDRLGVDAALNNMHDSFTRGQLVGARTLLPVLDRIASNKSLINRARERAAELGAAIRQEPKQP